MKTRKSIRALDAGVVLVIIAVLIKVATALAWAISPLVNIALIAGAILVVIGLVAPGRR